MILLNLFLAREILIFFIVFAIGMLGLTFGGIIWMTSIWQRIAEETRRKRLSGELRRRVIRPRMPSMNAR